MATLDEARIERLRAQYGLLSGHRTTSVRSAAAGFRARAGRLTSRATAARRRELLEQAPDGDARRQLYTRAFTRKG
jgi:hypothetical protein